MPNMSYMLVLRRAFATLLLDPAMQVGLDRKSKIRDRNRRKKIKKYLKYIIYQFDGLEISN